MDFLTFFEKHITGLEKTGRNYLGWCPFHNDEGSKLKGFYLNPENGLWKCFSCGQKGNATQFCEKMGIEIPEEIQIQQKTFFRGGIRNRKPKSYWEPDAFILPPKEWEKKAMELAKQANTVLIKSKQAKGAREWLRVIRGLNTATIQAHHLGWIFKDRSEPRKSWGLPVEGYENILISSGLAIPYIHNERVLKIKIRRPDIEGGQRYQELSGSANMSFYAGDGKAFIVAVESELDALLLHQVAGDMIDVVATGSATNRPDKETTDRLRKAQGLLVSLDNDEAGERQAFTWWLKQFSNAKCWPVIHGKDHTEAFSNGFDLRAWIKAGLKECYGFDEPNHIEQGPMRMKAEGQEKNYSILCPYKCIERPIHPEVCKWHRQEHDPECIECERFK